MFVTVLDKYFIEETFLQANLDVFDLFLPFVNRYFLIQYSFSFKFCVKNGAYRK